VFYSDGILDARNRPRPILWAGASGSDCRQVRTKSADCVVKEIFKAVTEHAAGVDTFDDQTVVAIKVKAGAGKRK